MATTTKKTTTAKPAAKKTTAKPAAKKLSPKEVLAMLKEKYDEVSDCGGVYRVKHNGKWGFADANGVIKIKPCFTGIETSWTEDIMTTWGTSGVGFINKKLEEIAKPQLGSSLPFKNGITAVRQKSGKWGIMDKKGKMITPFIFDELKRSNNGTYEVKIGSLTFVSK